MSHYVKTENGWKEVNKNGKDSRGRGGGRSRDGRGRGGGVPKKLTLAPCLGVIRMDYDHEAAPGDVDSHESYAYDVFYRVVPGLTFDVCKGIGKGVSLTDQVLKDFKAAIEYLDKERHVYCSARLAPRTRLASTH